MHLSALFPYPAWARGVVPSGIRGRADLGALRQAARAAAADWAADWAYAERGRFALWLPLLMAAGAALYLLLPQEPAAWAGGAACMAAAAAFAVSRRRGLSRAAAAMLLAVALGFAGGQWATVRAPASMDVPRKAVLVSGVVQAVDLLPEGRRVTIAAPVLAGPDGAAPPAARLVRIRLRRDDMAALAAGDRVTVRALLSRPSPPAYPGGWDLQRDAFFSGMGAYGFALGRAAVQPQLPGHEHGPAALLQTLRETIAARIGAVLSGADAAIATTLLTGNPSAVSAADKAAFRDAGLAHLLAIAGLHIGIVMGLAFGATRLGLAACERTALHWPIKAIAAVTALAVGGCYMELTGAHVPIVRSFAMACLFTVAVLAGRRAFSLRGWALAMAAVVLMSPDAVLGVSFQMSFSAVLALIAGYDTLRPFLTRIGEGGGAGRRLLRILLGLAITSVLAGTASAPFAAYHFGKIQLYFVLANLAAVPLTAFWIMPAGLLALALMPLHLEALALMPMAYGERAVLWIARTVAALPDATLAAPPMPGWGLVLVALGMAWLGLWRTRLRLAGMAVLAAGLLSPLAMRPPDVLVSADARLIGLRTAHGVFVQATKGAQHFEREAWEAFWAAGPVRPLPEQGPTGDVVCDAAACRWRTAGGPLVVVARGPPDQAVCGAALLLSAEPVRVDCVPRIAVIDRFSVWRDGAYAAWIAPDGVRTLSDRAVRGSRPWVAVPTRSRSIGGLPLAPAETLPPE